MKPVLAEVKAYAEKIDAQTNTLSNTAAKIAGELKELEEQLVDATTPEEVAALLQPRVEALDQLTKDLLAIGKNPASISGDVTPEPSAVKRT